MGSSKKHKEKDREHKHKRKHRSRDRSRSKERKHRDKSSRGSKGESSKRAKYDESYAAQDAAAAAAAAGISYMNRLDEGQVVDTTLDASGTTTLYRLLGHLVFCFLDLNSFIYRGVDAFHFPFSSSF